MSVVYIDDEEDDLSWMPERERDIYQSMINSKMWAMARAYADKAWLRRCTEVWLHRSDE